MVNNYGFYFFLVRYSSTSCFRAFFFYKVDEKKVEIEILEFRLNTSKQYGTACWLCYKTQKHVINPKLNIFEQFGAVTGNILGDLNAGMLTKYLGQLGRISEHQKLVFQRLSSRIFIDPANKYSLAVQNKLIFSNYRTREVIDYRPISESSWKELPSTSSRTKVSNPTGRLG